MRHFRSIVALVLTVALPAWAGAYMLCDIFNGRVGACGGWYQGSAVVKTRDGTYRECRIFNGQPSNCGSWYQGTAPVLQGNAFKQCRISGGRVSSCGGWFRGKAVVYH